MNPTAESLKASGWVEVETGRFIKGHDFFNLIKPTETPPPPKRIRQSTKPLMNGLEQEWGRNLDAMFPNYPRPHPQAVRLKIGNGAWYKGDFFAFTWPQPDGPAMPTVWECKGPKQMKNVARGMLAIKTAAHQWPEIAFVLVWKDNGQWITQRVLP